MTRLKQAKDEAEKEMVNYRSHVESEYQKKLAGTSENSGATMERLDEKTEIKIKMLKESTSTSRIALLFSKIKGREDRKLYHFSLSIKKNKAPPFFPCSTKIQH